MVRLRPRGRLVPFAPNGSSVYAEIEMNGGVDLRKLLGAVLYAVANELALPKPSPQDTIRQPSETALQNNLDRAVEYRKDYYKFAIGIATALLAFTVSFQPQLAVFPEQTWLEFIGWGGLGVAVLAGVRVHMVWAKFFVTFRKYDNRGHREKGVRVRQRINAERRILDVAQILGLMVGVAGVVAFTAVNLKHVAVKSEVKGVTTAEQTALPRTGAEPNSVTVSNTGAPATQAPREGQ